ncbi:MAG: CRISPR system precrRNA processing endoribonuclease RAMP protein Cas6 [Bacillota bacterium]
MLDHKCEDCNLREKCPYSLFFNPFLTEKEKKETSSRFHNKPRPFVFEPEITGKTEFEFGDSIKFKLNIFGKMNKFLPYIIESWKVLQDEGLGGKRSKFILKEVWQINNISGQASKIYDYQNYTLSNKNVDLLIKDFNKINKNIDKNKIELLFKTPIAIKNKGKILKENLSFYILMKNLFRRLSSLSAFYGKDMSLKFDKYLQQAKNIDINYENLKLKKWYRYSNRQHKKIKMQGLKGNIIYKGNLNSFIKFLLLGQYIHIGKNTVFGQGKYLLVNRSSKI